MWQKTSGRIKEVIRDVSGAQTAMREFGSMYRTFAASKKLTGTSEPPGFLPSDFYFS
jgi:hypothetical protein